MSKRCFQLRAGGWILLAAIMLLPMAAMAQDVTDGRPSTFMDYFQQGGFIMWPLLGMAVWATAILIEMLVRMRKRMFCPDGLMREVSEALSVGDYQKAWNVASADPSPLGRVLAAAIAKIPKGRESVEEAGVEAAANENSNFKIKLSYISLVAAIGPMVGLFGTISGMIGAFNSMAFGGAVGDPTKLAGDIGEALITTYGGLLVAIPAMMAYFLLLARLKVV
ncbi:MAG: MotA/TolQ/ExbB proton channel family protein [Lentisphaerae bacterium]|nr:MotA/TolQ/ExbB proton channel family protein [Lentisphaerota bacterium]